MYTLNISLKERLQFGETWKLIPFHSYAYFLERIIIHISGH